MPARASKRRDFTQIATAVTDAATGNGPPILPLRRWPVNDTRNPHVGRAEQTGGIQGGEGAGQGTKQGEAQGHS